MPTSPERSILRELAKPLADIAALPIQQQTQNAWKALNGLRPVRPMVMVDQLPWHELNVDDELTLRCQDPFCKQLETDLRRQLYRWKHIPTDQIVEAAINIPCVIQGMGLGLGVVEDTVRTDAQNTVYSHHYVDQLQNDDDLKKIRNPQVQLDAQATARRLEIAHDIFDGILEVRRQGALPSYAPWDWIVTWRGGEPVIYDLADRPQFLHSILQRMTDAMLCMLDQLEAQGLLGPYQADIHCTGAWSDELPAPTGRPAKAKELWTFGMSQIMSTTSMAMHEEFERPYLGPWFERFGLVYYGCCEPLDRKMEMVRRLPKVRKVSMSPWVDVEQGASQIGRDFVFSRKPTPALLAGDSFDPQAVERDLRQTLDACGRHGCPVELILKDVSTVRYEPKRVWEWSELAMKLVGAR